MSIDSKQRLSVFLYYYFLISSLTLTIHMDKKGNMTEQKRQQAQGHFIWA